MRLHFCICANAVMTNDRRYDFICGIHNDQHDGVVRILEAAYMKSVVVFCSCDAECALLDIAGEVADVVVNRCIFQLFCISVVQHRCVTALGFILEYLLSGLGFACSVVEGTALVIQKQIPIAEIRGEVIEILTDFFCVFFCKSGGIFVYQSTDLGADQHFIKLLVDQPQAFKVITGIPMMPYCPNPILHSSRREGISCPFVGAFLVMIPNDDLYVRKVGAVQG